ncbi:armadillo repeat-containing protein 4 [Culex quinquefasciatus]|uniref:Armadillo repeat-containing protein 4 n=1 Tax=Culex quinquefasciatus TaxID=7176 RepID=B0WQK7_CULQU|nr:armadillo repeat-containing protein 4 [Culex quinquefasciatus]|eukprot:XP_001850991.1 armadillo repeat-containing protein 4 [Culex quinquefasciatus]
MSTAVARRGGAKVVRGGKGKQGAAAPRKGSVFGGGPAGKDKLFAASKPDNSEESDSTDAVSSSDEEERWKESKHTNDVPSEYWHIQKLVKYMKAGNQTATIVALCCLKDHDLTTQMNQRAIQDCGGLEVLVNLLESNDLKCRLGALTVLSEVSSNLDIRRSIVDLGGIPLLVQILSEPGRDLKIMAAETLGNVAKVRLARKLVRKCDGVPRLVDLLDVPISVLRSQRDQLSEDEREMLDMARAGARALWSLSESRHNKELMCKGGIVPLMGRLLKSVHIDIVVPTMGTIQQCASQANYQLAITTEGMIYDIVSHLTSDNLDLKRQCSSAIFKCASDKTASDMVRDSGGLEPLVGIAKDKTVRDNKPLLAAATGALWKCAASEANVKKLDQLKTVQVLVQLLNDESEDVLTNAVGCISECVKYQNNREILRQFNGIPLLVNLLNMTHAPLLENIAKTLKECASDPESMTIMEELDAIRLIWSLLKNSNPKVQAHAAWALCPCIENAKDSGELVRSFVGALELVVGLLSSRDNFVLSAVCAAIATIAKDRENLSVLSDHKVIQMLAHLVYTTDDLLRENLAAAIASCAPYANNTQELGRLRTVTPIVGYMVSNNPRVHRTTAMALQKLSEDPQNCITMHQSGVVPFLLETVGSKDRELQEASAGCLQNIRKLALRAEELEFRGE